MSRHNLKDYARAIHGHRCRQCGAELTGRLRRYTHALGWLVEDFDKPQWLYLVCSTCGQQWSFEEVSCMLRMPSREMPHETARELL